MVEISEIKDKDSLSEWLEGQPREVAVAFAARSALRVLPVFWEWSLGERARKGDLTALPVLRSSLISGVASESPTPEIRERAACAATAARAAAFAADIAARAADIAAAAVRAAIWGAVRADCEGITQGKDLWGLPLWPQENPLADLWSDLRPRILSADNWQPGDWTFWVEWYEQMLDPTTNPPNWALLEQVALIDPEVWDAGPEAVSAEIAGIQKGFADKPRHGGEVGAEAGASASRRAQVQTVQAHMERHRKELPATFDAVEALLIQEIETLQSRNYRSDDEQKECVRQIGVLVALYDALQRLKATVPSVGPVTEEQAEEALSTFQLYRRELAKLPREKVHVVKDGVWSVTAGTAQFALVAGLGSLGAYIGLPATAAMAAAAYCVAPKVAGGILAAAKEMLPPKS